MCVCVGAGVYTGSYITYFNHTTPYGDDVWEVWEQVHSSSKYGWKNDQIKGEKKGLQVIVSYIKMNKNE